MKSPCYCRQCLHNDPQRPWLHFVADPSSVCCPQCGRSNCPRAESHNYLCTRNHPTQPPKKTHLFIDGEFESHSGQPLSWKIECDALTDKDIATLARLIASSMSFGRVVGVPRGGMRIAAALEPYVENNEAAVLIVDDVLTTGASMEQMRLECVKQGVPNHFIRGAVLFSRGPCPSWIQPVFRMFSI